TVAFFYFVDHHDIAVKPRVITGFSPVFDRVVVIEIARIKWNSNKLGSRGRAIERGKSDGAGSRAVCSKRHDLLMPQPSHAVAMRAVHARSGPAVVRGQSAAGIGPAHRVPFVVIFPDLRPIRIAKAGIVGKGMLVTESVSNFMGHAAHVDGVRQK